MVPAPQDQSGALNFPSEQSVGKSMQRLRWFISSFEEQIEACAVKTGIEYKLDTKVLTDCFVTWIKGFEATKPENADHRPAYVGFAAGKMLKHLINKRPISVVELPKVADRNLPEYFWPEGYVYVSYCLNVRHAVLRQDYEVELNASKALEDLRTWWSFKENVNEMPDYAIGFLDLFAGEQPNWSSVGLFNGAERTKQLEAIILDRLSPN